ncbi:hypothetical protein M407DRAFT_245776 [Tulasnella calospora MUT 4182]|uniref:Uncharacterized protein n=1 Tax=Tulasnella calospora MUT 4182 TaxID=1051891 RepID=A0A0C3Q8A9_9AGAM|nr:hypothetical protein M407DRAFT_245776 [Tulasnella calospora MUT 4182]
MTDEQIDQAIEGLESQIEVASRKLEDQKGVKGNPSEIDRLLSQIHTLQEKIKALEKRKSDPAK